jgi:GNAT superfamily N-acetyltransferase
MKIDIPSVDDNPPDADVRFLEDRITEYNVETTGITDGRILSFFIRDERQEIVAGLFGWTWGGACEIRDLWVRKDMRKNGYGKALMAAAEDEAVSRRCTLIALDTHSFQAPAFYRRLGFEMIGSHRDYPRGHLKHYLRKTLKG